MAKSLPAVATASGFDAHLWVASAGYGLVPAEAQLRPHWRRSRQDILTQYSSRGLTQLRGRSSRAVGGHTWVKCLAHDEGASNRYRTCQAFPECVRLGSGIARLHLCDGGGSEFSDLESSTS